MENNEIIVEIGTGYTSIPAKVGAATEIVAEELTYALMKRGREVIIFDIKDTERVTHSLPIKEVNIPSFVANKIGYELGYFHKLKRVIYSFSLSLALIKFISKRDKYILHFHNQYNFCFYWLLGYPFRNKHVKLYYTTHTGIWTLPWKNIEPLVRKKYFMEAFAMKNADKTFVLNTNTYKNVSEFLHVNKRKLILINNGVNINVYHKIPANDASLQSLKSKLKTVGKTVLFHAGSIDRNKNQLGIIKELSSLMKNKKDILFFFAGGIRDHDYFKDINDYCKLEGIETYVSYLGELSPGALLNMHYNLSDALILSSKFESFGLVVIESLAAGLPVILSENLKTGNFNEKQNGILGYSGKEELESIIEKEIENKLKQQTHSTAARRFAVENYSWDKIAENYFK